MAAKNTIKHKKGEDLEITFQMKPIQDVTGQQFRLTVKKNKTDSPEAELIGINSTVPVGTDGKFVFVVPSEETMLPAGDYEYDVWRTDYGSQKMLSEGPWHVEANPRFGG